MKILTAEEFLKDKLSEIHDEKILENLLQKMFTIDVSEVMIEFAEFHVEAALKEASKQAELNSYEFKEDWMEEPFNCTIDDLGNINAINKESILNAYPLTNIK